MVIRLMKVKERAPEDSAALAGERRSMRHVCPGDGCWASGVSTLPPLGSNEGDFLSHC